MILRYEEIIVDKFYIRKISSLMISLYDIVNVDEISIGRDNRWILCNTGISSLVNFPFENISLHDNFDYFSIRRYNRCWLFLKKNIIVNDLSIWQHHLWWKDEFYIRKYSRCWFFYKKNIIVNDFSIWWCQRWWNIYRKRKPLITLQYEQIIVDEFSVRKYQPSLLFYTKRSVSILFHTKILLMMTFLNESIAIQMMYGNFSI